MPEQTIIYYSKKHFIFQYIGIIIFIIFGGVLFQSLEPVILFTLFFLISIIVEWKKLIYHVFSNEPQIILTKEGLETPLTPFTKWENVSDIKVFRLSHPLRRGYMDLFTFTRKNGLKYEYEKMEITELDISIEKMDELVKYYKNL